MSRPSVLALDDALLDGVIGKLARLDGLKKAVRGLCLVNRRFAALLKQPLAAWQSVSLLDTGTVGLSEAGMSCFNLWLARVARGVVRLRVHTSEDAPPWHRLKLGTFFKQARRLKGLEAWCRAATRVTSLHLHSVDLPQLEHGCSKGSIFASLKELQLHSRVAHITGTNLSSCAMLEALRLTGGLSSADYAALATLPQLQRLTLFHCWNHWKQAFGGDGEELSSLTSLTSLCLDSSPINTAVTKLPALRELQITMPSNGGLGAQPGWPLQRGQWFHNLEVLHITDANLGSIGGPLQQASRLHTLVVERCPWVQFTKDDLVLLLQLPLERVLQALERDADQLLAQLAEQGSRPLAGTTGAITSTTARLAALQACLSELEPTIAGLETAPLQPTPAGLDVLWRQQNGTTAMPGPARQPAQSLSALIEAVSALPGINLCAWEGQAPAADLAAATLLSMQVGPSVLAAVQLAQPGSLVPLRVALFAPQEQQERASTWPWCPSGHLVFRRASEVAAAALRHFTDACGEEGLGNNEGQPGQHEKGPPLELLLLWLATYSDLFSRPCSATGALLSADPQNGTLLPPVYRPYRLLWTQLRAAAADPSQRVAYHWQNRPDKEGADHLTS
ncbi:hypothetical protein N2152v2_001723 [Parachlorella kessleri]